MITSMRTGARAAGAAALLTVLALGAAGCTTDGRTEPRVEELVWATGGVTADGAPQYVADLWNKLHPEGPRVRVEPLPRAADAQRRVLATELNAGLPDIDILELDLVWTAEFADKGWLRDLEALRAELDDVALVQPLESAIWKGTLWAAPYTTDVGLLFYRKDLVPNPPTTQEAMVDIGAQMQKTHPEMAQYVADGAQAEGLVVQFLESYWARDGTVTGTGVRFDDAKVADTLRDMRAKYLWKFYAPEFDTLKLDDANAVFAQGGAVFLRSWPYAYRQINSDGYDSVVKGKVGIAPLPPLHAGRPGVGAIGGHNLAVSAFSDAPVAAQDFVRFATTTLQVQWYIARHFRQAPALEAAYDAPGEDPLMPVIGDALASARGRPVTPYWAAISEDMQRVVYRGYVLNEDPVMLAAELHRSIDATVESG